MSAMSDMTAMLMQQAQKLMDSDNPDQIEIECKRSKALTDISGEILDQSRLFVDTIKIMDDAISADAQNAARHMLGVGNAR